MLLLGGMVAYFVFSVMDKKLDQQIQNDPQADEDEEKFSMKDVASTVSMKPLPEPLPDCLLWGLWCLLLFLVVLWISVVRVPAS